jgi:hypothetical protein
LKNVVVYLVKEWGVSRADIAPAQQNMHDRGFESASSCSPPIRCRLALTHFSYNSTASAKNTPFAPSRVDALHLTGGIDGIT